MKVKTRVWRRTSRRQRYLRKKDTSIYVNTTEKEIQGIKAGCTAFSKHRDKGNMELGWRE